MRFSLIFTIINLQLLNIFFLQKQSLIAADFGDDFDGIYADLDEATYGPIKYQHYAPFQFPKTLKDFESK